MKTADSKAGSGRGRILLVTPFAPWNSFGGTATVSRNLITLLSGELPLDVCCIQSPSPGAFPRQENGATVLSGPVPPVRRKMKALLDFSPGSFATRQFDGGTVRARFAALVEEARPRFILFDHVYSAWLAAGVRPGVPLAYIAHDDMAAYAASLLAMRPGPVKRLRFGALLSQYRQFQGHLLRRCDFTLALTREDAELLQPGARNPIELAPVFFDAPDVAPERPSEFTYLIATGSFDTWEKRHGLTVFLEQVFAPLARKRPGFRMIVAGRMPQRFRDSLPAKEPSLRIVHGPTAPEMTRLTREAGAAAVLDLQASGLKIKTMEMAAAGLPIVAWAAGIAGTRLEPGASCLLAKTPGEFQAHLERLHEDGRLRASLGSAARAVVEAFFSRDAARARFRESGFYQELCRATGMPGAPVPTP